MYSAYYVIFWEGRIRGVLPPRRAHNILLLSLCLKRYIVKNYWADFDEIWYLDYGYTVYLHIYVIFFVERIRGVLPPEGVPKPTFTYKM